MDIVSILESGLANYKTTAIGATAGALGYSSIVGVNFPQNRQQWIGFVFSLLIAAMGLLAKDSTTGSQPINALAPNVQPNKFDPPKS